MSYYTKITRVGLAAITAAMNNKSKVPITYMAFGDGNGIIPEPHENATSLVNEIYRTGLNKVDIHNKNPNWLVCEAIIPSAVGGFNIREVGLFDDTGTKLLAIANYPPTYKPATHEGAAKIQTIRIVIQVDNSGNFELVIDPDIVLSTVEYVDKKTNNVMSSIYDYEGFNILDTENNRIVFIEKEGISGYFKLVMDSVKMPDGGIVIKDSQDRIWERVDLNDPLVSWFGAYGNGVTNDTTAFTLFENVFTGKTINLLGKTYLVSKLPSKNTYVNGYLKKDGVIFDVAVSLPAYASKTFTVGSDGDFPTINAAFEYITRHHSKAYNKGEESISTGYAPDAVQIAILLKSGFVMQEQIIIRQTKLGHITILSEDPVVTINRASLTKATYFKGTTSEMYPTFFATDNSELPLIACLFQMDNTGTGTHRHGIVICRNSNVHIAPHCGVTHAGGNGLFLREGSNGSARLANFSYAGGDGLSVAASSNLDAHGAQVNNSYNGATCYSSNLDIELGVLNNCTTDAIVADSASTVNAQLSNADNAGRYGIRAHGGSTVFFIDSTAKSCGSYGVYAFGGSTIVGTNTDISNSKYGFRAIDSSTLSINNAKAMNCVRGIILTDGSTASANGLNVSGYTEFGGYANIGSTLIAANIVCGTEPRNTDVQSANGSVVYMKGSSAGTSVEPNIHTVNGIIIK